MEINKMEIIKETIVCPGCGAVEEATIEISWPFFTYMHHCSQCAYIIMESEFESKQ